MKWREIIIGAIVTLLITVIGGLVVWEFTKKPPSPEPKSSIVIEYDTPAIFESDSKRLLFNTIRVGNVGDKTAHDIFLAIEFPNNIEILDSTVSISSGGSAYNNQKELPSKKHEKLLSIKSLMPDEVVTISILVNGSSKDKAEISARYNEGIGKHGSLTKRPDIFIDPFDETRATKAAISALTLGALLVVMTFRLKNMMGGKRSVNNSAFMMLHQGMVKESTKLLEGEIARKGGTSYELANLGLCKSLSGDIEGGENLFKVAELYSSSKSIKTLVAFNRAIAFYKNGQTDEATKLLELAIKESKFSVEKYLKFSKYAVELVGERDEFSSIRIQNS